MIENVYLISDNVIIKRMGKKIQECRLKQNITQKELSDMTGVSLSTVQKIERGDIGSVIPYIRILRTLRMLDRIESLIEEESITPNEYMQLVEEHSVKYIRKHATGNKSKK